MRENGRKKVHAKTATNRDSLSFESASQSWSLFNFCFLQPQPPASHASQNEDRGFTPAAQTGNVNTALCVADELQLPSESDSTDRKRSSRLLDDFIRLLKDLRAG